MTTLHGAPARFDAGLSEIAPGVHAWLQPNGSWGETNAALVSGEGESLLVDTLWTPALTRRMLDAMSGVTATAPVRRLVNTHADGDHCWGNELLQGLEIVATDAAVAEMRELTPKALLGLRRLAGALRAGRRLRLPGTAAGPYVSAMLGPFDFSGVDLTPPTRTFEGALELDVGGRRVELMQVGPAHTSGDLIVHVPDARAVLAADVVFNGVTPVMWAGPVERWLQALDRIAALEPDVVLPGHGPPARPGELQALRDYWTLVEESARLRFADGRSPAEAAREILGSDEFKAGPWEKWDNPERIAINLHTLYRHLRGDGAGPVTPAARIRIFTELGSLAAELSETGR